MLPSLLLLAVSTLVGAVTLPFNKVESDFDSLGPRNLFNRQSKFQCSNGYFCDNSQICCGVYCCNPGYACSQYYTCEPSSSICSYNQQKCGSTCCNSGYYCATDLNCYPTTSSGGGSNECSSSQTACGSTCCDSGEKCDSSTYTCSSTSSSQDDPPKDEKPHKSGGSSKSSKAITGKALAGIVVGVLAGVALVFSVVSWFCCGCFGKRKKKSEVVGQSPPAYVEKNKGVEQQVQEVTPEAK